MLNGLRLQAVPLEQMKDIPSNILYSFTIEFTDNGIYKARYSNRNGQSYFRLESGSVKLDEFNDTAERVRKVTEGISTESPEREDLKYRTRIYLPGPLKDPHFTLEKYDKAFDNLHVSEVLLGPFGKLSMDKAKSVDLRPVYSG